MVSRRPQSMIRKLSELLVPGNKSVISPENSPKSPLDMKFSSPGSSRRYDSGGIGLGIVATLEKSNRGINRHEILAKNPVCCSGSGTKRSDPVRVSGSLRVPEIDLSEEYAYVTCHDGPTKRFITKVYDEDGFVLCENRFYDGKRDGIGFDGRWRRPTEVPEESPATKKEIFEDFLSSCCLCKKKLSGKDIYMYKGEKGFCSEECRSMYIMKDESKEQCRSEVSRSVDVSSSPYTAGHIFSTGIFVF